MTTGDTPFAKPGSVRIHLDLLGGLAGDMFIAALLDAFPEHEAGMLDAIGQVAPAGAPACASMLHGDGVLRGRRFVVGEAPGAAHPHSHPHAHVRWQEIHAGLVASALQPAVFAHAVGIFGRLAEAEAAVHGVAVDAVEFHEVGAWDSIADIVGAAHLIEATGAACWSVSAIPLGSGRVKTAHGMLPVPAPATTLLLRGFDMLDDGIGGERVTPTGAAILAYLCQPEPTGSGPRPPRSAGRLRGTGIGFGSRRLPGLSNCVRALVFETSDVPVAGAHRQLAVIEFEVDDQSAEDLAMGLTHLRADAAVFDVVQAPVFGKKGRMMSSIRVLASLSGLDGAIEACFRETTTIGLRHHVVNGAALVRRQHEVALDDATMRVKSVVRPGGQTAKTESEDVAAFPGHALRSALRTRAERLALPSELLATNPMADIR